VETLLHTAVGKPFYHNSLQMIVVCLTPGHMLIDDTPVPNKSQLNYLVKCSHFLFGSPNTHPTCRNIQKLFSAHTDYSCVSRGFHSELDMRNTRLFKKNDRTFAIKILVLILQHLLCWLARY
jgi:hypothetical protein